ncbi:ABC transporter permease [Nitrincola tapanii]|uniref:ABC transporter permease n=1 Tax=Nitrincola tapanii TaxID=1708751 RepID=A0A5A9WAE7_9GAMM|nr:ABC transporter permease [Nitrincola tapanii]KAA0876401.1 ABC transporter permease [Nitrincola tapanii]
MKQRVFEQLLVLLLLGCVWQGIALWLQDPLLPSPWQVGQLMQIEAQSGALGYHLWATLQRVFISFTAAMCLGVLLGVFMGALRPVNRVLDPVLVLMLNLPALVLIILLYVWLGLVEAAALLAVVLNKIPNVAVNMREGARSLDPKLAEMAQVYGFSFKQKVWDLWLPQLFPYLMASMRGGLALIWKIVLVVELLGRSNGVGFQLHVAFQMFDVAMILAYSFAFIAVVQLIEWLGLQPLEQRARRWQEVKRHA